MMSVFILVALSSVIRFRETPSLGIGAAAAGSYALALLSKEAAILFPVVAFPYLARGARRPVWRLVFALAAVAAVYLVGRALVLRGPGPAWGDVSLRQRVLLVLNAIGRYAVAALVPFRHQLSYPDLAGFAAPGWPTLAGVVALAVSLYVAWRERGNAVGLGSGLFVLTVLPASNFFPPGPSYLAERLLYLPSAGAVLVVVALVARAAGLASRVAAAAGLGVCLAMAVNVWQRLPVWRDELSLSRTMVREMPNDPTARRQLAQALIQQGKTAEAIAELRLGVGLNPNRAELRYELASLLRSSGDLASARVELEQLTAQHPEYSHGHSLLGTVLLELGLPGAAAEALIRALQQMPDNALVHNDLGVALDQLGRTAAAEQCFRRALELSPGLALAHNNLGEILLRRGQPAEALVYFRQALSYDPNYGLAYLNSGFALKQSGEYGQAVSMLLRAQELMPDFPGIAETLKQIRSALRGED